MCKGRIKIWAKRRWCRFRHDPLLYSVFRLIHYISSYYDFYTLFTSFFSLSLPFAISLLSNSVVTHFVVIFRLFNAQVSQCSSCWHKSFMFFLFNFIWVMMILYGGSVALTYSEHLFRISFLFSFSPLNRRVSLKENDSSALLKLILSNQLRRTIECTWHMF